MHCTQAHDSQAINLAKNLIEKKRKKEIKDTIKVIQVRCGFRLTLQAAFG